ncbi:hypothetical protein A6A10_08725 [Otariodibacter oris]|nr:hypothetical protein A6A10_08725 [Otariodibacter oris]
MNSAIAHYLDKSKRLGKPLFTFVSLWSDEEPYTLDELLMLIDERIEILAEEFKQHPIDSTLIAMSVWRRKKRQLQKMIDEELKASGY